MWQVVLTSTVSSHQSVIGSMITTITLELQPVTSGIEMLMTLYILKAV